MATAFRAIVCFALAMTFATASKGNINVHSTGSGTLSDISVVFNGGAWEVYFTATALPNQSMTAFVDADSASIIRYVIVNAKGGSNATVQLIVQGVGPVGKIVRVENILPDVANSDSNDSELWITPIQTATNGSDHANIGEAGDVAGGVIAGHVVLSMRAARSVTASIINLPPLRTPNIRVMPLVEALTGSIVGDLTNPHGSINIIQAPNGHIGPTGAGTLPLVFASGEIQLMTAKSINADTFVTGTTAVGCQCLKRVVCTDGSLRGELEVSLLGAGAHTPTNSDGLYITNGRIDTNILIAGNLRGGLGIDGTFSGDRLASNRTITIGAGIQPNAPVTIAGPVAGQIILNANNATQTWGSTVSINGVELLPNLLFEYPETSSQIGRGAVGMVPFRLYAKDCSPIDRDTTSVGATHGISQHLWEDVNHQFTGTPPVKIRFYGPIQKSGVANWYSHSAPANSALFIQCKPLMVNDCTWVPAPDVFKVVGPGNTGSLSNRGFEIYRKNTSVRVSPGLYRVIFQELEDVNGLFPPNVVCAGLGVSLPPGVVAPDGCIGTAPFAPMTYEFRVWSDCDEDGRDDQEFAPDPTANGCNTGCRSDYNRSGTVTVQDIFDFIAAWFEGAPCLPGTFPPAHPSSQVVAPCYGTSIDYNLSTTVDVPDIFAFLNDWFAANCN